MYSWLLFAPAVGLWVASLFQPALMQPAGGLFQYSGLNCLMLGWIGAFGRPLWVLPWSANVLFWMGLVSGLFRSQPEWHAALWSLVAIPLALIALANRTIEMNEGGERAAIVPGLGFYLWLGSMVCLASASCPNAEDVVNLPASGEQSQEVAVGYFSRRLRPDCI